MRTAQETLPTVTDKVAESAPGLARQLEGLIPGAPLPAEDVGGQDFADIPRFPGMARAAQLPTFSLTGNFDGHSADLVDLLKEGARIHASSGRC